MPEPAPVPSTIAGLLPQHRHRASQAATSGGNVVSIPNEGSAGGALSVVSGTLAAPVADALLSNAPSVSFTGSQEMRSSLPANAFKRYHDGSVFTAYFIGVTPASSSLSVTTYATVLTGPGLRLTHGVGNTTFAIANGVNSPSPVGLSSACSPNTPYCTRHTFAGGQATQFRGGVAVAGPSAPTNALSSADPAYALTLGRWPTLAFGQGRFAEVIIFDRALSAPELAVVDAEIFATYGQHA